MNVIDLLADEGQGPLWGDATDDLNVTLLAWRADGGTAEHVNDEQDVVLVVIDGTGTAALGEHAAERKARVSDERSAMCCGSIAKTVPVEPMAAPQTGDAA